VGGAFGALGFAVDCGAPDGAPGFGAAGAAGESNSGSFALQKGQLIGLKLGDTIFFSHSGQINGPLVVSGGRKHIETSNIV